MSYTVENGRLGNQIIRNICTSMIAERHNLYVEYCNNERITSLGIELFIGSMKHMHSILLTDDNFFQVLDADFVLVNIDPNSYYFQTRSITQHLYNHFRSYSVRNKIIDMNSFRERYNNNNDCFIHIRLDDVERFNPGIEYYLKALSLVSFDNLYIASDSIKHPIIREIQRQYPTAKILEYGEIETIQFGSTNKYIVLSYGTFSSIIGYLAFYSVIYYQDKCKWDENDTFSMPGWNRVDF